VKGLWTQRNPEIPQEPPVPGFSHFLRCVGRASLNNGARALASLVPMGDVLYGIATDAWEQY
jgi:hypothetical protein